MPAPRSVPAQPFASVLLAAGLALAAAPVAAVEISGVEVRGLDEAMAENVLESLTLNEEVGRDLSERRLDYLLEEAEFETREALEPFGYYDPAVRISRVGGGVVIEVEPGDPVRIRSAEVDVRGPAADDAPVREALADFEPGVGEVLDHAVYEASKARIARELAARGYFDAELPAHRVEVNRAERAADIDLVFDSGRRYALGNVDFTQTPEPVVYERLLERLVPWEPGQAFEQAEVERLREKLRRLDYFAGIEIEVQPQAAEDGQVPVAVTLTPAKPNVYTAGLSYGTESGVGVHFRVERRYLNMLGHKAVVEVDWSELRKNLLLQYRIPAFGWIDGWYAFSARAIDEQTAYINTRRVELIAARSGEVNEFLTVVASVHALRERWAYVAEEDTDPDTPVNYRYASVFFPSLRAEYIDVDDRFAPRAGMVGTVLLRGGPSIGGISDSDFLQAWARVRMFHGLDPESRLIARAEAGRTFTESPRGSLPPTLRFHAGGENSIRGYALREVGPSIGPEDRRFATGGRNVVTASLEYERYFTPQWGAAAFVDVGSAFNDSPDWHTGVGVGVRWRSPVGPVRIDIARGLNTPDSDFQLYFGIGTEL